MNPLSTLIAQGHSGVELADDQTPTAVLDAINATQELIERLEAQITPPPNKDEQWYSWIPNRLAFFFEGMRIARATLGPGRHRFLEVGSGMGRNLCLAHQLGFDPVGIELHEPYIDASHRVFPHLKAYQMDATIYEGYYWFDLVYCYRIAVDREKQNVINQMIT